MKNASKLFSDQSLTSMQAIRKPFREVAGECPIHGSFRAIQFFHQNGQPVHPLTCPKCFDKQQKHELRELSQSMARNQYADFANSAGLAIGFQSLVFADLQSVKKSVHAHALHRAINQSTYPTAPMQIRISGGQAEARTVLGSAFLMDVIRHAADQGKRPSCLYLPADFASIVWSPYKGEEFLSRWGSPRVLFVDDCRWETMTDLFQRFLTVMIRMRSLGNRITLISRQSFDDNHESVMTPRGASVISLPLDD